MSVDKKPLAGQELSPPSSPTGAANPALTLDPGPKAPGASPEIPAQTETTKGIADMTNSKSSVFKNDKEVPLVDGSTTVQRFSPEFRQCIASIGSITATLAAGMTSGYSAILLPQLKAPGSNIYVDDETGSWIASMAALPMSLGCIIAGLIMEKFGRKLSHLILNVPFLIGWLFLSFAPNLAFILLGRFFTGLCVGLLGPLGPVYIGEISDPKLRGFLLAAVSLAIAVGILIAHVLGTYIHWKTTAFICALFPIISFGIMSVVPESPSWLISKDRTEDGIKAFRWLRGYSDEASKELTGLLEQNQKRKLSNAKLTIKEKLDKLKQPEVYKPLVIMIIFFMTAQFSGVNAVAFYSVQILKSTLGEGLNEYLAMIVIDIVRVVMSVVACILLRHYGRRPLAFVSGITTVLSLFSLALYSYFSSDEQTEMNLAWIPLTCMVCYICAISIGIVPLPWCMCGEVFSVSSRGVGSGISSAVAFASFFIVVKTSPSMFATLDEWGTFLTYGSIALVGTAILYFVLPETKGKSLKEIEDRFRYGKHYKETSAT